MWRLTSTLEQTQLVGLNMGLGLITFLVEAVDGQVGHDDRALLLDKKATPLKHICRKQNHELLIG
jgi:hypothetical protein